MCEIWECPLPLPPNAYLNQIIFCTKSFITVNITDSISQTIWNFCTFDGFIFAIAKCNCCFINTRKNFVIAADSTHVRISNTARLGSRQRITDIGTCCTHMVFRTCYEIFGRHSLNTWQPQCVPLYNYLNKKNKYFRS